MNTLTTIQHQILEVDDLLARLRESAIAQPRHSVLAQIRSLEKEQKRLRSDFDVVAQREEQDVCRYAIEYPERPTISGVAAALSGFQNAFSELYTFFKGGTAPKISRSKAKSKEARVEVPQLAWGYEFAGSFGVAMTLPTRDGLWNDPVSESAIDAMFQIAQTQDDDDLSRLARQFGPPAIVAVHRWADVHAKNQFGVGINWKRHSGAERYLELRPEAVCLLRDRLAKTSIQSKLVVDGSLVAVDYEIKQCRVKADDGREIAASFELAITEEQAARVPARYSATITESKPIVAEDGKEPEGAYFLDSLSPLGG
jgi:hypothetical protein